MPENRDGSGRWQKGQTGNPGGRPKQHSEFIEACREMTPRALRVLRREMRSGENPLQAAVKVLEWAWGKPTQAIAVGPSEQGGPDLSRFTDEQLLAALAKLSEMDPATFSAFARDVEAEASVGTTDDDAA